MRTDGRIIRMMALFLLCGWAMAPLSDAAGDSARRFSHSIHPCAPEAARGADRARANTGMVAWLDEHTLRFEHWLDTYCNADNNLIVTISLSGRVITVKETYTGRAVRCRCVYKISGEARSLRPGTYRIRVVFDNRIAKSQSVIEETGITVP